MIILCLPFDNGIRSMLRFGRGITGAREGPIAVFNLIDYSNKKILNLDRYNINDNMEKQSWATERAHNIITDEIKEHDEFIISIGGDHSLTYPIVKGLKNKKKSLGIIYLDAHFDMRSVDEEKIITSGNSFWRLIKEGIVEGKNISVLGIENSGTDEYNKQFIFAVENGVSIFHDVTLENIKMAIKNISADQIYVSIDVDSLKDAPGVSAPAINGISKENFYLFLNEILKIKKLVGIDFMEISSRELSWDGKVDGKGKEKLEITAKLVTDAINYLIENNINKKH